MKRIAILGAGTAGTIIANRLARKLPSGWNVTVVDQDNVHVYRPGLLFVPFGHYRAEDIVRPRKFFFGPEIDVVLKSVARVEPERNRIAFEDGETLDYDVLIVATGARLLFEETEGLTGKGWQESVFDFYTLDGAIALRNKLAHFEGGRVVVNVTDMPISCPVAPHEFSFLADAFFEEKGMRGKVELVFATPLDGAFTKPRASEALGGMFESRNVAVETNFSTRSVDGEKGVLTAYDGREIDFDLLVNVPLHGGNKVVTESGLGDEAGFLPTNKHTLQSDAHENIFALGDCTNVPASKAGAVAHFQAEVLDENVLRFIEGQELLPDYDGHTNCFIETGHGKAMLIDFNYEVEPLPGRFPLPGVGPFRLLEESAINHWGKLGFKWVYWNLMMKGQDLPLDHRLMMAGKRAS